MWREEVVHDDEVDLLAAWKFDTMQTIETREKGVRVRTHMLMVLLEDASKEGVFVGMDGLDDEPVISRKVEERS